MQDRYAGDIGDYCKLGLLRALAKRRLSLSINWYKTEPNPDKPITHNEGNFIEYSKKFKDCYNEYDEALHEKLADLIDQSRNIKSLEELIKEFSQKAKFYTDPVLKNPERRAWHDKALKAVSGKSIVFLDPDNGIETEKMMAKSPSQKHVRWSEIAEYYERGQSVIIYQHKYRITDSDFIKNILYLQSKFINADAIRIIKYSSYGIRYFIILLHKRHSDAVDKALASIEKRGQAVTKELSSIKNKKNSPKFCEVIYPRKK